MNAIVNVLADRYATPQMQAIWSPEGKIEAERRLWIAVLRAQQTLGRPIDDAAIKDYEKVITTIDVASIDAREKTLLHDVKARIEEFNALAGHQLIHEGMTSRDLTDNVEMLQVRDSIYLVRDRAVALLHRFAMRADEWKSLDICGRTHNVPAQTTTLGKRFATWAEELLLAFEQLQHFIGLYPLRGIKGPVGTQQDMVSLLGSPEHALELEQHVRGHLRFGNVLESTAQVYPRSLDFAAVALLVQLAAAPTSFALTLRLMAGQQHASEGFSKGQTGSSAMPHKMNSRTCERICGFMDILRGHLTMSAQLAGNQWYEGDVSCSVVRRVALSDSFFAIDGLFEAAMTVLDQMTIFPLMIERELMDQLPFLSTTQLLVAALDQGLGREDAHAIIKQYATEAIRRAQQGGAANDFIELLDKDERFPLREAEIRELLVPNHGRAVDQTMAVITRIRRVTEKYNTAARYTPQAIR